MKLGSFDEKIDTNQKDILQKPITITPRTRLPTRRIYPATAS